MERGPSTGTMIEQIIAAHAGRSAVDAGEIVGVRIDLLVSDELSFPDVVAVFEDLGAEAVCDPDRVVIVADHETPAPHVASAERMRSVRTFASQHGIRRVLDAGRAGIMHVVLPEAGWAQPGGLIAGYDSHMLTAGGAACAGIGIGATDAAVALAFGEIWVRVPETVRIRLEGSTRGWVSAKDVMLRVCADLGQSTCRYRSVEYAGSFVDAAPMDARFTIANMSIELGAKAALLAPDAVTFAFLGTTGDAATPPLRIDPEAEVESEHVFDVGSVDLTVALPGGPDRGVPVGEASGVPIDQVFIGSCTNGRIDDLRIAADVLAGREVHPGTRLIVVPGSPAVLKQALSEGLIGVFVDAGAVVMPPGCGPCAGLHMGVLADGERALATSSRNFPGRMGAPGSEVLLAGPAVAAATAVAGVIADPADVTGRLEAPGCAATASGGAR